MIKHGKDTDLKNKLFYRLFLDRERLLFRVHEPMRAEVLHKIVDISLDTLPWLKNIDNENAAHELMHRMSSYFHYAFQLVPWSFREQRIEDAFGIFGLVFSAVSSDRSLSGLGGTFDESNREFLDLMFHSLLRDAARELRGSVKERYIGETTEQIGITSHNETESLCVLNELKNKSENLTINLRRSAKLLGGKKGRYIDVLADQNQQVGGLHLKGKDLGSLLEERDKTSLCKLLSITEGNERKLAFDIGKMLSPNGSLSRANRGENK